MRLPGANEYQREAEANLVRRARENSGHCLCGQGDTSAALRLVLAGFGQWKQSSPFVFEFVLKDDLELIA